MKKETFITILAAIVLMIGMGYSNGVTAEVNINVGIGVPPPPPLVIPAPPPMFVIPRTYVYFAPEVDANIFFYHGYWYRPYQGHWYRSGSYNGRWAYIAPKRVPSVLLSLPPDFRRVPPGYRHILTPKLERTGRLGKGINTGKSMAEENGTERDGSIVMKGGVEEDTKIRCRGVKDPRCASREPARAERERYVLLYSEGVIRYPA